MTFFKGSRYERIGELELEDAHGRLVRCKRPRYIPETLGRLTHVVAEHDRLDLLGDRYLGDPERYWRICDANRTLWPPDLLAEPGTTIQIPGSADG
jgi:nucleoid-associated protein YgaU